MTDQILAPRRFEQPDGKVRVTFAHPILLHDQPKGFVTFRQPTTIELWEIGDPRSYVFNEAGLGTSYVDRDKLRQWIGKLMIDHDMDIIGREPDLSLGMLIEQVVLDFFTKARTRLMSVSAPSSQPA